MNPPFQRILNGLIALIVPFFLLMTAIRIMFTPVYLQVEYRAPGFPADTYGFTLDDRLHYGRVSMEYLLNNSGIEFLAEQRLPDGKPLYNDRELSHMVDVKLVLQGMVRAWWVLLVILLGLGAWAWRTGSLRSFWRALGTGGKLTIGLIVLILAAVAISFNGLFTAFHKVFFTGDTWLFYYSDSLIRLFPIPFWRDAFILVGLLTILSAILCIYLGRRLGRKAA